MNELQHLFTSKKDHSVLKLSLVLRGRLHERVEFKANKGHEKNEWKGIKTSFCCLIFVCVGSGALGFSDLCCDTVRR